MKICKIALIIYFTCCFLATLACAFKLEGLMMLAKPLIVPALFFYYFIKTNKTSVLVCLFLLFAFIGDSVGLMNFPNEIYYILVPFFISYFAMVVIIIKNLEGFKFKLINVISITILAAILIYIWVEIIGLFSDTRNVQLQIGVFGLMIFILALVTSYNIIWRITKPNLVLVVCVSCVIISDVFYILYNYQNNLIIVNVIHFMCQMFSYFFFVRFVLLAEKKPLMISK